MNPLESAQTELVDLLAKKDDIDRKIAAIQQSIQILEPLYGRQFTGARPRSLVEDLANDVRNLGITDAIERVLMSQPGVWMAPTIVRDHLVERGYQIVGDNPMANVHTVLKRLVDRKGPIVSIASGKDTVYRYDPSVPPPSVRYIVGTPQPQPPPQITAETLKQFENNPLKGKNLK
jgi:hypothetical protein